MKDQAVQEIFPGHLQTAFDLQKRQFAQHDFLGRLWAKDYSLWPKDEFRKVGAPSNLTWLDFPDTLESLLTRVSQAAELSVRDSLLEWVFIALGSSSLAARSLLPLLSAPQGRRLTILDSCHPSSICRAANSIDIFHAGFILANKNGSKLEDHALFLHFQDLLRSHGIPSVNQHFVSLTESSSFLAGVSREYTFRASFFDPPNVLSSYSSLLHFGALLIALSVLDPENALRQARATRELCSVDSDTNPALQLALFLSAAALAPCHQLVFLTSPALSPYSTRLGHLVGGSLVQETSRLIPICGDVPRSTQGLEENSAFVCLTSNAESDTDLHETMAAFRSAQVPFLHVQLSDAADLLSESFKWEIATVLACSGLRINPFSWPDARYPRRIAMQLLEDLPTHPNALLRAARVQENGIQIFAEGPTRSELSTLNLTQSLRSFFHLHERGSTLALLVFLDRTAAVDQALHKIRDQLTGHLRVPVLLAYGPRSLDNYSYLSRNTFARSLHIVLTADYSVDISIPGANYSFAQLHQALCLGEFDSFAQLERHAIRIHLLGETAKAMTRLEHVLEKALSALR